MSKEITFAIIGFGHIGRRHATIIKGYENTSVVGIIDTNTSVRHHDLFPPPNTSFFYFFGIN